MPRLLLRHRYDFYHCVDAKTQEMMMAYADKFYMDEDQIRKCIRRQYRWDHYKAELVKDVLSPRARP